MEDDLNSISKNNVWELSELLKGAKPVGCKWVFKTKLDPNENIKRYKARLVAKGYTQKETSYLRYKGNFLPKMNDLLSRWLWDMKIMKRDTYENADYDYDTYDDMYEGQEIPDNIQSIC
ncbi:putative zinc finger, CCHC-type containing protein, partial [Tanacetum coccineum]